MQIVQIVPYLPPSVSGVGDYASLLARALSAGSGIDSSFILVTDSQVPECVSDFPVLKIPRRAKSLAESLPQEVTVCLHYVGYGYQKRGYAAWLAKGLRAWKSQNSRRRLITMFHEVFATGRIWNSSFWLSSLQRSVARTIANMSDRILTNRQVYAQVLAQLAPRSPSATVIAVPSTIGEPIEIRDYKDRRSWLVVFGGDRLVRDAFMTNADAIRTICDRLQIERTIQIGSSMTHDFHHRPVEIKGVLTPNEVSDILSQSKAGFLNYGSPLGKSTIFAAYCAHAVAPIFPFAVDAESDGIFRGTHYLTPADLFPASPTSIASDVAKRAHEWYLGHDINATARVFAQLIASVEDGDAR